MATTKKYLYILIALFFLQFIFVNPIGNFGLNDDWVHAEIAKHWAETGDFRMNPFSGPSFYVPILYETALIKLFGTSFTIFRISTLFFALGALILFYKLLLDISHKPKLAFVTTLLLWFNPIFYAMSFTSMTDVPALFFVIAAVYSYYKGFTTKKPLWLFLGSVLSIFGMYTRQTNILTLAAAGLYSLTQLKQIKFRHILWSFGVPSAIGLIIYYLLGKNNLLPPGLEFHEIKTYAQIFEHARWWFYFSIIYIGLHVLPLAFGWSVKHIKTMWKPRVLLFPIILILTALYMRQALKYQFPYVPNTINKYSLGPIEGSLNGIFKPYFSTQIWGVLTLLIAGSAGWFLYVAFIKHISIGKNFIEKIIAYLKLKWKTLFGQDHTRFITWFGILFLLPILWVESFDRYFLSLFVVAGIIVYKKINEHEISFVPVYAALALIAIFSMSQTAFYLNWAQVRWDLANKTFAERNIELHQIDGGYEWDGWNGYWQARAVAEATGWPGPYGSPWWIRNLFVNNTQEYLISNAPFPDDYNVLESRHVPGWNPNNTVYSLEKIK